MAPVAEKASARPFRVDVVDQAEQAIIPILDNDRSKRVAERPAPYLRSNDEDLAWLTQAIGKCVSQYRQAHASDVELQLTDGEADVVKNLLMLRFHPGGPLAPLMGLPDVSEIHILGWERGFWYDSHGGRHAFVLKDYRGRPRFKDYPQFKREVIDHWVAIGKGGTIDATEPIKTIVLPETRWRIHVALDEVADPPAVTARKQQIERFQRLEQLSAEGAFPEWITDVLMAFLKARLNMLIAGATGSGKTTLLRVLMASVPLEERLVTIEDTPELYLGDLRPGTDLVSLTSRQANAAGHGMVDMARLSSELLRMTPDRAVVGEVRAKEAFPMVQVMSSGVDGSACTLHAQSARQTIPRLVTYMLQHPDQGNDEEQAKKTLSTAIDLLIYMRRFVDKTGRRRMVLDHVSVPLGYERGEVKTETIIQYDRDQDTWRWVAGHPSRIGTDEWRAKLEEQGVDLAAAVPESARGSVAERIGLRS